MAAAAARPAPPGVVALLSREDKLLYLAVTLGFCGGQCPREPLVTSGTEMDTSCDVSLCIFETKA